MLAGRPRFPIQSRGNPPGAATPWGIFFGAHMLNEEQLKAVEFLVEASTRQSIFNDARPVGLVGWAGTGKTYATAAVIRRLQAENLRVAVLAPTHRACGVLRGELQRLKVFVDVDTVHRGCGLIPCDETGDPIQVAEPTAKRADVVIVDEASMVSTALLAEILKLKGRKIFVGDSYQLPPVGEKEPPAFKGIECARLTETVRYKKGSVLDEVTDHLRACIDDGRHPDVNTIIGCMNFIDGGVRAAADLFSSSQGDAVVLGYRNETVASVCARIQGADRYTLLPGEPVVFVGDWAPYMEGEDGKMERVKRANNGTEATVHSVAGNMVELIFPGGGRMSAPFIPPGKIKHFENLKTSVINSKRKSKQHWSDVCRSNQVLRKFADKGPRDALFEMSQYACIRQTWASTVHKSQGGSYDRVMIMWDDLVSRRSDPQLFARLLYVAVTRSRNVDQLFFIRG